MIRPIRPWGKLGGKIIMATGNPKSFEPFVRASPDVPGVAAGLCRHAPAPYHLRPFRAPEGARPPERWQSG